jgi:hypothetical protein
MQTGTGTDGHSVQIARPSYRAPLLFIVTLHLILLLGASCTAPVTSDLQLWMPVQVVHPLNEKWSTSMQVEYRMQDDISEPSCCVARPRAMLVAS